MSKRPIVARFSSPQEVLYIERTAKLLKITPKRFVAYAAIKEANRLWSEVKAKQAAEAAKKEVSVGTHDTSPANIGGDTVTASGGEAIDSAMVADAQTTSTAP